MCALQLSKRGGQIGCIYNQDRVRISGSAITLTLSLLLKVKIGFIDMTQNFTIIGNKVCVKETVVVRKNGLMKS